MNIPCTGEIVAAEGSELQYAFQSEQHGKNGVHPEDRGFNLWTLLIILYHNGCCLETDKKHDDDIKDTMCYYVKNEALELVSRAGCWFLRVCIQELLQCPVLFPLLYRYKDI